MNIFVHDAFIAALKEGMKIIIVGSAVLSYLKGTAWYVLRNAFIAGIASALISSIITSAFLNAQDVAVWTEIGRGSGLVFALLYIGSVAALYQSYGLNLFGYFKGAVSIKAVQRGILFVSPIILFSPGLLSLMLYIHLISDMKENFSGAILSAVTGLAIPILLCLITSRIKKSIDISRFITLPNLLLLISLSVFIFGSTQKLRHISFIPAIIDGLAKLFHDLIHMFLTFLLLPDHPIIATPMWRFIGFFFSDGVAAAFTLCLLLLPPFIFLYKILFSQIPEVEIKNKAKKRKFIALIKAERIKKAVPAAAGALVLVISFFITVHKGNENWHDPEPMPVVEANGVVTIPLFRPGIDLMDGSLHKFIVSLENKNIRFLIIKRPDGRIAVCLDACEICPPEGYAYRHNKGDLMCKYCNTPIPIATVGLPGGCNPIPIDFNIQDGKVIIEMKEIAEKYRQVKSGPKHKNEKGH